MSIHYYYYYSVITVTVQEEVMWWTGLMEPPSDVVDLLEFLIGRYTDLSKPFKDRVCLLIWLVIIRSSSSSSSRSGGGGGGGGGGSSSSSSSMFKFISVDPMCPQPKVPERQGWHRPADRGPLHERRAGHGTNRYANRT